MFYGIFINIYIDIYYMFLQIKWINQFSEKEHQHESYNLEPLSVQGMSQI